MTPIPAVTLSGPTASGKTAVGILVAKACGFEILSADSMQIFRGMDIGTAKPTPEERAAVPHHLIDFLPPNTSYSVSDYVADAKRTAEEVVARGRFPLFVGGTGLYHDALSRGEESDVPKSDPAYREKILEDVRLGKTDEDDLRRRLSAVDPESEAAIARGNLRRIIRALEIFDATGIPKSRFDAESKRRPGPFLTLRFTLVFRDRETLYRSVDERVDAMIREGLPEEAKKLAEAGVLSPETTAGQAIGYKELLPFLSGECTLAEATETLKRATRHYAKRQLTWFRHDTLAHPIFADDGRGKRRPAEEIAEEIIRQIGQSGFPALPKKDNI